MSEGVKKSRPEFRNINAFANLPNYRWPMAAIISGMHRFSGLILFLALPLILYLLDNSLESEGTFGYLKGLVEHWYVKLVFLAICWAYLQHFCSGIRHLFMDVHIGLDKDSARKSAVSVLVISLPLTALVALKMFGVF